METSGWIELQLLYSKYWCMLRNASSVLPLMLLKYLRNQKNLWKCNLGIYQSPLTSALFLCGFLSSVISCPLTVSMLISILLLPPSHSHHASGSQWHNEIKECKSDTTLDWFNLWCCCNEWITTHTKKYFKCYHVITMLLLHDELMKS